MKDITDLKTELLESRKFKAKFSKNLLEDGANNVRQGICRGYMYSRLRKIRVLDKYDIEENRE